MSDLIVKTNNVPRDVVDACELSPAEREEFGYLDWTALEEGADSASFVRYRGELLDLGEFSVWVSGQPDPLAGWDGYRSDTFFSGLVVRFCDDREQIVVGRYYS